MRQLAKEARVRETGARIGALRASGVGSWRAVRVLRRDQTTMCSRRPQLRAFRDATAPILQDSLDEDARAVKDHVRVLHASVEAACTEHAHVRAASAGPWSKTPASLRADMVAGESRRGTQRGCG